MEGGIAAGLKRVLSGAGYYRRALGRIRFPGVAVLCYHGVRDDDLPDSAITFHDLHIRASNFSDHCRMLRESCDPISLDDWRAALAGRSSLPARPVLVTFDDGYRSVLRLGAPVLAEHGIPAAVFVCTGPMRTRTALWFDAVAESEGHAAVDAWKSRDYDAWRAMSGAAPVLPEDDPRILMTPEELAVLSRTTGIEVGGHTAGHPILANATAAQQRAEIEDNLTAIREWTGTPARAFAYPNGRPGVDYNSDTIAILHAAGVDLAFTTHNVFSKPGESPLELSRFLVVNEVSSVELAHRLAFTWPR